MREMAELSPITYYDQENTVRLDCFADTFVYHKASGSVRNLVAMRFGGYPEQVRAMADVLRKGAGIETVIENHKIILYAKHDAYKRSITHDGIYAEGTMLALDDENGEMTDEEQMEVENPKAKRKMYIFCDEGDTDSLYAELDKKTAIPLIPEFKDYILDECFKRKILVQLEVLSASVHFDAYMLEVRNDEKEIEQIVNDGLKTGQISIPNAVKGTGFENIETVSQYLNKYGITIANRIRESFNPLFDPASEYICDRLKRINGKFNLGELQRQLAKSKSINMLFEKSKIDAMEKRPLLPLNIGQVGLIGGSGLINGYVDCENPHVIKGRVIKEIKKYEDEATNTLTETRVNRMLFNVLTPDGLKRLA